MTMPAWTKPALMLANLIVLCVLLLMGADAWVRHRVDQGIAQYHQQVIMPMTQPRPPAKP